MCLDEIGAHVAELLGLQASAAASLRLEPLAGGGNNRVFAFNAQGRDFVAKVYFSHPSDDRDRLGTEYAFLSHAREAGVRNAPRPIARNPERHLAVYERVPGQRIQAGQVDVADVDQAAAFFLGLNRSEHLAAARALPIASEAAFRIVDHLQRVEARIERLDAIPAGTPVDDDASRFARKLKDAWPKIVASILRKVEARGENPADEVVQRCISPSDFGFHNALRCPDGHLNFIDFEYAGWDDPAKMVGDFFCQPAVPAPRALYDRFVASTMSYSAHSSVLTARAADLFPLFQVKWCCIMLNHFLPDAARRRQFADPAAVREERKRTQLDSAMRLFDSIVR